MSTRDVYDTIYDPNGAPWPGLKVTFDLIPSSYVLNGAYPSKRVSAVTDAEGAFTLTLWCSDEGLAQTSYQVTYPNDRFTVRVPVGTSPITLSELRAMTAPEGQPPPSALAAHEAAADPHAGYLTPPEGDAAYAPLGHVGDYANPHQVTAAQTGALTTAQADGRYPLRSNNLSDLSDAAASRLHIAAASEAEIRAATAAVNQGNGYTVDDLAGVIGIIAHDTYNPVAYGADITGASDDTTAFQAAANDAMTYGGTVDIPRGTFNLSAGVSFSPGNNKRIGLHGAGYQTLIKPTVDGLTLFKLDTGSSNYQDMQFGNLRIEMGAHSGVPIRIPRGGQTGRLSQVWVRGGAAMLDGMVELGIRGRLAAGTAVLSGTAVASVTITNGGRYYDAVNVTFTGGSGTGAAGTAVITNGVITGVTITNPGTGYLTPPAVAFVNQNIEVADFDVDHVYCYANLYVTDRPAYAFLLGTVNTLRMEFCSSVGPAIGYGNLASNVVTRTDMTIDKCRGEKGVYGVKFIDAGLLGYTITNSRWEDLSAAGVSIEGYDANNLAFAGLIERNYFTTLSDTGEAGVLDSRRQGIVLEKVDGAAIIGNSFYAATAGQGNPLYLISPITGLELRANRVQQLFTPRTSIVNYSAILVDVDIRASQTSKDLDTSSGGGQQRSIDGWYYDNAAASLTNQAMTRLAGTAEDSWVALRAGSITGIWVRTNAARTAGTLTATIFRDGIAIGLAAILNGVAPGTNEVGDGFTFRGKTQGKDINTFAAGTRLDIRFTTDSGWLPITADIRAGLEVEM